MAACCTSQYPNGSQVRRCLLVMSFGLILALFACSRSQGTYSEIIIALSDDSLPLLKAPSQPDPLNTGIASLDFLNEKWRVTEMQPVFPNLSEEDWSADEYGLKNLYLLRLPASANIERTIREYIDDPNIEHAEPNAAFEGL